MMCIEANGIMYYNAGYYDPELSRLLQADPVLDGLNRYVYFGNNPIKYFDPSGMLKVDIGTGLLEVDSAKDDFGEVSQTRDQTNSEETVFPNEWKTREFHNSNGWYRHLGDGWYMHDPSQGNNGTLGAWWPNNNSSNGIVDEGQQF
jgi:hypothetical protein